MKKILRFVFLLISLVGCSEKTFTESIYDKDDRLIEEQVIDEDGNLLEVIKYKYLDDIRQKEYYYKYDIVYKRVTYIELYRYHRDGIILRNTEGIDVEYFDDGNIHRRTSQMFYGNILVTYDEEEYNENGNLVKNDYIKYDSRGGFLKRLVYEYQYHSNNFKSIETIYRYDEKDNIIDKVLTCYSSTSRTEVTCP
ncbi:hypothetical protein RJG79_07905 [Mycoplasmatota bacterium WC44]